MNIKVVTYALLLCISVSSFAQKTGPQIEFDNIEYDFGTITIGQSAKHEFIFTNTGDEILVIEKVFPNRYISVVNYTKGNIEPGKKGIVTLSFSSEEIGDYSKLLTVKSNATNTFRSMLCMKGKVVSSSYEPLKQISNTTYIAKKDKKIGIINYPNNIILPFVYDDIFFIERKKRIGYYAKKNGKWGALDDSFNTIIPHLYDSIKGNNYYFLVKKDGKWGCLDNNNKLIIQNDYEELTYHDGFFAGKKNGKWGVFDMNSQIILDFIADEINWGFYDGKCFVARFGDDLAGYLLPGGCCVCRFIKTNTEKPHVLDILRELDRINYKELDCNQIDSDFIKEHTYTIKKKE